MLADLALSHGTRTTAGILLLTILAVEYGGIFMLRVVQGQMPATPFQKTFFRAGHAHAGVLVILSLIGLVLADATKLSGLIGFVARNGIWIAAILIPAGYFLSATGKGLTRPNQFIYLLYAGIASLSLGVLTLGIGLLTS